MPARVKIVTPPEPNWRDRIYLFEICRGIIVTSRHFFRNLFLHFVHEFGWMKDKKAGVTISFPEEQAPLALRLRTRHRIMHRKDGQPRCVACMMCETICPAGCIAIVAKENPDPDIEKMPESFVIHLDRCVYCGFCVEACPEDAIRMDTKILDTAAYLRKDMVLDLDRLLHPERDGAQVAD